jgi:hypothetical protein
MPSEDQITASTPVPSRWEWLFSQGLGVLCGQATVLLLAVGSIVLSATRDGASAMIAMDDIRGFFAPTSPVHFWFYLLIPVLGLYGLNTLLATCRSVLRKWRAGARFAQAYAPSVIHLAFLFSLVAHLIGGLGSDLFLLTRPGAVSVVELYHQHQAHEARCAVVLDGVCQLGELRVEFLYLQASNRGASAGLARLRVGKQAGGPSDAFWLAQGQTRRLPDGSMLSLERFATRPAILLRGRHAPGNPWALLASLLLALGLLMMWRRFIPVRSRQREEPTAFSAGDCNSF